VWPCIVTNLFTIKPTRCTNFANLFCHETLHVRTVRLSIIRSLFTVHSAMACVIRVCRQLSSRTRMELLFHPGPAPKLYDLYLRYIRIPLLSVQWIDSWRWTEELSETCRVSWQNKFVNLVHLLGFITKKSSIQLCRAILYPQIDVRNTSLYPTFVLVS
jgi:hypothetical protein